ncbi:Phytocyanin domain [Sesbania bispinosa]|nr:Phytocyanin domain [Sesbania bispinosa]
MAGCSRTTSASLLPPISSLWLLLQLRNYWEGYANCNSHPSPIERYSDGNTKVKLDRPGPFYFISGAKGHCEKGQKVIVVVVSPKRSRYMAISPAPSPRV